MAKSSEQPNRLTDGENLGSMQRPEETGGLNMPAESEPRYNPGEYRVEISVDAARKDIEKNFPDFKVEQIEYLSQGMGSVAFLVNGELVFRFAKNDKADASIQKEIKILPLIQERVDLAVPKFEYAGKQRNKLGMVGYKMIEGTKLEKRNLADFDGKIDPKIVEQLAIFFRQLHSTDAKVVEAVGLHRENIHSRYENELMDARDYIFPLLDQAYPKDVQQIKNYIEQLFAGYLNDEENFKYTPAVLHGDLEAEHIIFNKESRKVTGIIDWGAALISDPDYDLFRPYSHYGSEFIEEFLKYYPHSAPERLRHKLDFFFRAQMAHRTVRAVMIGDQKRVEWHLERLVKQALGIGYWYHELQEHFSE